MKIEDNFITGLNGRIILFEENKYIPLLTIILNGDEKIHYKNYSILFIEDVMLRNHNDQRDYLCDVKLYDNIIDISKTYIPCLLHDSCICVNCRKNNYGELFSIIVKE